MLLEWRDQDNYEKGWKEGFAEGYAEGTERCAKLMSTLFEQGRVDDVKRAVADPQERARLAAELGIELPSE